MTASTRRELRSAATSTSTTAIGLIRALTDARPIKPTSTRCLSARRPNPGRGSTYRRGNSVQTTAATSVESQGWCVYEWNPGDFGLGSNLWLDYPHVALSSNFVWYSANVFNGGEDPRYQTTVIWRIPLDVAADCPSRAFDFFVNNTGTFTQVEGATDTMYW